jgi:tetratricopeptide (TPR) repeat protein
MAYCEAAFGQDARAAEHYAACREALQAGPTANGQLLKKCLLNHGVALSRLGKREQAAELYREGIALDESYAPPYFNLGLLYAEQPDKHEEAIEALRKHIAYGGERSVSARNLIRDLQKSGE